jgi:hypothetical protein
LKSATCNLKPEEINVIQLKCVDLGALSLKQGESISLSQPEDLRWVGVRSLGQFESLQLENGARNDTYVLFGKLTEFGREYSTGSFFSRGQESHFQAGGDGAIVFMYRDQIAKRSGHETLNHSELTWFAGGATGMSIAMLSKTNHRFYLVSWQPGTHAVKHIHPYGEEIFVINGELKDERGAYPAGSWIRLHPGSAHEPYSEKGALILLRNGHLVN